MVNPRDVEEEEKAQVFQTMKEFSLFEQNCHYLFLTNGFVNSLATFAPSHDGLLSQVCPMSS